MGEQFTRASGLDFAHSRTRDIQDRLENVLKQSGVQAITLYGSVDPRRRERWIEDHGYVDTLITNPRLVQTGLDLVSFQTVVFYEPEYSLVRRMAA